MGTEKEKESFSVIARESYGRTEQHHLEDHGHGIIGDAPSVEAQSMCQESAPTYASECGGFADIDGVLSSPGSPSVWEKRSERTTSTIVPNMLLSSYSRSAYSMSPMMSVLSRASRSRSPRRKRIQEDVD